MPFEVGLSPAPPPPARSTGQIPTWVRVAGPGAPPPYQLFVGLGAAVIVPLIVTWPETTRINGFCPTMLIVVFAFDKNVRANRTAALRPSLNVTNCDAVPLLNPEPQLSLKPGTSVS